MVNIKMDKKINNLEGTMNAFQKQLEERDQRFVEFQTSMNAILQQIEARFDAHDHCPRGRNRDLNRKGAQGVHDACDDGPSGQRRARTLDLWRKLEIPLFQGDDAYAWVDRIERFFEIRGVPKEECVSAAMMAMEGKALTCFKWWEKTVPLRTWEVFKEAVVRRFQPELI